MTKITLIRHCEAMGNYHRVFQGMTDAEISENGKKQLELLSVRCRNMDFAAMYSSPLRRAYQTAQAANRYHQLPIIIEPGLVEINGGEWEGIPWADLPARYPRETEAWNTYPHAFQAPNGESMQQVYDRIWNTVLSIARKEQGRHVCAVSHGCAIRALLCRAQGLPLEALNTVDWCDNTAISVIVFDDDFQPHIERMNDASHLTEEVSTFAKQNWWRPENRGGTVFE